MRPLAAAVTGAPVARRPPARFAEFGAVARLAARKPEPTTSLALLSAGTLVFCVGISTSAASRAEAQAAERPVPAPASEIRAATERAWALVPEILARISAPRFPARDFLVTAFGARGDGKADAGEALRRAIEACHKAGGGRVVVPPGDYLTGPIHLKSGVELHVSAGATLRFSQDPARYLPVVLTRFEGVELMNYSPLVYALDQENIAITGEGTLDGQADLDHWWPWKTGSREKPSQKPDRDRLFRQAEDGVPVTERVYGAGHYLRSSFVQPYRCRNVLIEGVTLRNSPMWMVHPVLSTNVTVRGVKAVSAGPNTDGCDPESCRDVLIEDSLFDNGDDCIALKSGRNADGRRLNVPIENVVIRGCRMRAGHGGVTLGSEISGGARNVFAERCSFDSPELERGLRLKTNARRGGVIENVYARDIEIAQVAGAAIDVTMYYEEGDSGQFTPVIRNIGVERMRVAQAEQAFLVLAYERSPLRGLFVADSVFRGLRKESRVSGALDFVLENVTLEPQK